MRSVAASIVGWLIVAIVVWLLFGWIVGTILWIVRMIVVVAIVGGLLALYSALKR